MNLLNGFYCFWLGQVCLGMGGDGEPEVTFVVVNSTVEFLLDVFGLHSCYSPYRPSPSS